MAKGAQKTGGSAGRTRAANSARASYMKEHNIRRTTFRDPITGSIRAMGSYPGMEGKSAASIY